MCREIPQNRKTTAEHFNNQFDFLIIGEKLDLVRSQTHITVLDFTNGQSSDPQNTLLFFLICCPLLLLNFTPDFYFLLYLSHFISLDPSDSHPPIPRPPPFLAVERMKSLHQQRVEPPLSMSSGSSGEGCN